MSVEGEAVVEQKGVRRVCSNGAVDLLQQGNTLGLVELLARLVDQTIHLRVLIPDKVRATFHSARRMPDLLGVEIHITPGPCEYHSIELRLVQLGDERIPLQQLELHA